MFGSSQAQQIEAGKGGTYNTGGEAIGIPAKVQAIVGTTEALQPPSTTPAAPASTPTAQAATPSNYVNPTQGFSITPAQTPAKGASGGSGGSVAPIGANIGAQQVGTQTTQSLNSGAQLTDVGSLLNSVPSNVKSSNNSGSTALPGGGTVSSA